MKKKTRFFLVVSVVIILGILFIFIGAGIIKPEKTKYEQGGQTAHAQIAFRDSFQEALREEIRNDAKGIALATELDYLIRGVRATLRTNSYGSTFCVFIPGCGREKDNVIWWIPAERFISKKDLDFDIKKMGEEAAKTFFKYLKEQYESKRIIRGPTGPLFFNHP